MTNMIERIARVLARDEYPDQPQAWIDAGWAEWTEPAKMVLKALREPTPEMVDAWASAAPAVQTMGMPDAEANRLWATADWQAMIDAALALREEEAGRGE